MLQALCSFVLGKYQVLWQLSKSFQSAETEAVLLVDASNAFNSLHRCTTLLNIRHLCPSISTILINTYREDSELFIDGDTILSQEGTTQGDPLAMPMYAVATMPLIGRIQGSAKQVWYADDASATGKITDLQQKQRVAVY